MVNSQVRETSTEAPYLRTNPLFKKFLQEFYTDKRNSTTLMHIPYNPKGTHFLHQADSTKLTNQTNNNRLSEITSTRINQQQ
ncbi:hypothetical protein LguiA_014414 [Lonicera macranthoides]